MELDPFKRQTRRDIRAAISGGATAAATAAAAAADATTALAAATAAQVDADAAQVDADSAVTATATNTADIATNTADIATNTAAIASNDAELAILTADGDRGDITVSDAGATLSIDNSAVTLAKIANAASAERLLGSGPSGAGVPYVELRVTDGISFSGNQIAAPGIATNTANIATNTSNIATNTANIATNATAIDIAPRMVKAVRANPQTTISSTTLAFVFNAVIPANTLVDRTYRMTIWGDILQNSGADQGVEIQFTLGGTSYLRSTSSFTNDVDRYGFMMTCDVIYRAAGAQLMLLSFEAANAANSASGVGNFSGKFKDGTAYNAAVAETDTGDLTLQCNMRFNTSTTSSEIRIFAARMDSSDATT